MDKIWIIFLFLGVFFFFNGAVRNIARKYLNSEEKTDFVCEKEDAKSIWEKEGKRREPENADYILPKEDFFENEKNEFSETFEEEFENLSEEEQKMILEEAGLVEKEGD